MPPLDTLVALASGVPLALLGILLLAVRPRRPDATFFGAFAALWGAQVVVANLGRVSPLDDAGALALVRATHVLLAPVFLFLAHFAVRSSPRAHAGTLTLLTGVLAAAGTLVLLTAPGLIVADAQGGPAGLLSATLGPLAVPLFDAPFFGAFYLAMGTLYLQYRRSPPGSARSRSRALLLALALFTSYDTFRNLLVFAGTSNVQVLGPGGVLGLTLLFAAGALFLLAIGLHLLLRPPPPEEVDRHLLAALAIPALAAVLEGAARGAGWPLDTVGLWRLLTVGALVYALAKHQLFDLDLRLKRLAGPLGARLFPDVRDEPDYVLQRKLEVYRANLERALAEPAADAAQLRELRTALGITDREHVVMEFMARSSLGALSAQPVAPRVAPGALLLSRYRVERLLGEGAHGRVYVARDEVLGRGVAVKVVGTHALGGKAAKLLMREARLAGSLQHPGIVAVHDVAEGPDEVLIVMEFADAGNLFNLLQRRGRLGLREATELLDQVLAALEASHAKGIVHRDLKPENILLMRDGTVKLADFGVAAETGRGTEMTMGPAGTLLYMAPEQVRGAPADHRSDLYAAGVVFHQALSGRFYLRIAGKDDFQVRQAILRSAPVLPAEPAWAAALLAKALAKDPAKRFGSAAEMRRVLRQAERAPLPS